MDTHWVCCRKRGGGRTKEQTRAAMSRGNMQYPRRETLCSSETAPPRRTTLTVSSRAPAITTMKTTQKVRSGSDAPSDRMHASERLKICTAAGGGSPHAVRAARARQGLPRVRMGRMGLPLGLVEMFHATVERMRRMV